ncbi:MAG: glycoside hydrolase family 3 N-terminal domain-containing protein, partial [Ruminococcus sp.]
EEKVEELLSQMTLEEKIGQLNQAGTTTICTLPGVEADIDSWITDTMEGRMSEAELHRRLAMCEEDLKLNEVTAGEIGSFVNLHDPEKLAQVREAAEKSRMKIPLLVGIDIIRGFRTLFPTPIAMAGTFDMDIIRKMVKVAKKEALAVGINWVLGPMLDVARDARWGRIVESPGEDPYLASEIARTMIEEYHTDDGDGVLMTTAKHFLAYGAVSGGQDYNTVSISRQQLYDTYLPPFRAAIEAGVDSVMSAFHDLDGVPCTCNRWLLTDLLRDELGFDGIVVTDAEAVKQCVTHGVAEDEADAARLSFLAGNDIDLTSYGYQKYMKKLVEDGKIDESLIDQSVRRILKKKISYGLFEKESQLSRDKEKCAVFTAENREIAREAARRAAVLLKNDGVLPVAEEKKKLLIIGELADDREALTGPWAFTGRGDCTVTILEGMRNVAADDVEITYVPGFGVHDRTDGFADALAAAEKADFIIAVAGETAFMSGEASSKADLKLAGAQEEFLLKLAEIPVPKAVLLVNGRPLAIGKLQNHPNINAILETWHLGTESGNAIAEILFGLVNPSGKLAVTFANSAGQEPMYYNHPNTGKPGGTFKFTSKYQDVPVTPLYPFGYGLSYTTFSFNHLEIKTPEISREQSFRCSVEITNTGLRTGSEVVQVYVQDRVASCVRPVKELKRFMRVELEPGETKKCSFEIKAEELGFYNNDGEYIVEPGKYYLYIGSDSAGGPAAEFRITE